MAALAVATAGKPFCSSTRAPMGFQTLGSTSIWPLVWRARRVWAFWERMLGSMSEDYQSFLVEVKGKIRRAQYQALRSVNAELVKLYWDIGESIHRKQEEQGWGRSVVENLARD